MKIMNAGKTIATIITNHGMTLDEAIEICGGTYDNDRAINGDAEVCIGGEWYWYDDLELGA